MREGYKQTEIGLIPNEWVPFKLGTLVTFQGGSQPPKSTFKPEPGADYLRLIQIRDYKSDVNAVYIPATLARKTCTAADIMIGRYGPPVFQILRGIEGAYNVALIKAIPAPEIDREYLYYFLKQEKLFTFIESISQRTSGQTGVDMKELKAYPVPLPPPAEQQAIAEALGAVDTLLTNQARLLNKKRQLKQATLSDLLGQRRRLPGFAGEWTERSVRQLFTFLLTGTSSRSELSEVGEVGYIHYGDIHTKWHQFLDCSVTRLPHIAQYKVKNLPFLQDGDLVMADASEDYNGIGKSVEVRNLGARKVVAGLHTLLLRADKTQLADGFKGYLQELPAFKDHMRRVATGASVYGISQKKLLDMMFTIPPPDEQLAIAQVLGDQDADITLLERQHAKTQALKQGMMQELLSGNTRLS